MKIFCKSTLILSFFVNISIINAGEVSWMPALPYNYDRRQSTSDENSSSWDTIPNARKTEYRLELLMEAERNAIELWRSNKESGLYFKLSDKSRIQASETLSDLDETVEMAYTDAIPFFKKKANPNLLLMMLYHYNAYIHSGSESWPSVIESLRKIDSAITRCADDLSLKKR